ncbi:MAG: DoxX protein [Pseudomonadota bacterium]
MAQSTGIKIGLLAIRVSVAAVFLLWSVRKIIDPEGSASVFETFYFTSIGPEVSMGLGVAQTLLVVAFLLGLWKGLTYLAVLAMHTVSTASTWALLIDPYTRPNLLFWAAVPMLAALLLLYLARKDDTLLAFGR